MEHYLTCTPFKYSYSGRDPPLDYKFCACLIQLFDGEQKGGGYSQVKYLQIQTSHDALRGGVKIENRENFGQCPNRGGRGVKKTEMSQFQFGNFENRRGRVSIFQKCPNINDLFHVFIQFHL